MSRLQAALDGVGEETVKVETKPAPKAVRKPSREKTVLIGGHFLSEVRRQLRMIAAEEGTTTLDVGVFADYSDTYIGGDNVVNNASVEVTVVREPGPGPGPGPGPT